MEAEKIMSVQRFTITVFSENIPGLLQRVTAIFTRRKINIESLTVSETELHDISRYTIVVFTDDEMGRKLVDQIRRIIEVREAYGNRDDALLAREIAILRVAFDEDATANEVRELAQKQGARIAHISDDSMLLEVIGYEGDIDKMLQSLKAYNITEFIRSGRVAVTLDGKESERKKVRKLERSRSAFVKQI